MIWQSSVSVLTPMKMPMGDAVLSAWAAAAPSPLNASASTTNEQRRRRRITVPPFGLSETIIANASPEMVGHAANRALTTRLGGAQRPASVDPW